MADWRVRPATPADGVALAALERLAPEAGPIALRVDFHGDYLALGRRLGTPAVYVAEAPSGAAVGTLSALTRSTRLNATWAPTTYLYRLRVHPDWRRRGIARGLLDRAWTEARREHGTRVAWGAVLARNDASRALTRAAGFAPFGTVHFRVWPTRWNVPGEGQRIPLRQARPADAPAIAAQADALYRECQFWGGPAPLDPGTWVWTDASGPRASAAVYDLATVATVRVLLEYPWLLLALAALARSGWLPDPAAPLRVGLVTDLTFAPERPADGARLLAALPRRLRSSLDFLVAAGDARHPTGRCLRRLPWALPGRAVLVARTLEPIDPRRPVYLALA